MMEQEKGGQKNQQQTTLPSSNTILKPKAEESKIEEEK